MLPPVPETQAIQRYLKPLTQLARAMTTEDGPPSLDLLVEENVAQQVRNLLASQVVQDDWKRRGQYGVTVHGWVYQLENVSNSAPSGRRRRVRGQPIDCCLPRRLRITLYAVPMASRTQLPSSYTSRANIQGTIRDLGISQGTPDSKPGKKILPKLF